MGAITTFNFFFFITTFHDDDDDDDDDDDLAMTCKADVVGVVLGCGW